MTRILAASRPVRNFERPFPRSRRYRSRASPVLFATALIGAAPAAKAQEAGPPLDGRERMVHDTLLDHLAGDWRIERTMRGRATSSTAHGEWVLNHQFLLLHYQDAPRTATPSGYEAMVFIGYDNASERYVVHWIDIFGGRFSETLGYGTRDGNAIRMVFEYPDGPFYNTFTFDPATRAWSTLMRSKNQKGDWVTFATERFTK